MVDQQLDAAKAVIVVWSEASAGSKWVISEAEHGARRGTLITLKAPDFDVAGVPKPYGAQLTESVENRPAILAALGKLGVTPRYAPDADGVTPHDWFWNEVSKSNKQSEYELYLREFPEGRHAAVAKLQIARLAAAKGEEAPVERKALSETPRPARALRAVGMGALVLTAWRARVSDSWPGKPRNGSKPGWQRRRHANCKPVPPKRPNEQSWSRLPRLSGRNLFNKNCMGGSCARPFLNLYWRFQAARESLKLC